MNIKERKELLLSGKDLSLAIEGRYTNLKCWLSDGIIYFRIDRYNQYFVTLDDEFIQYLNKPHKAVTELNKLYGFNGATIEDVDNILEITKDMKYREIMPW